MKRTEGEGFVLASLREYIGRKENTTIQEDPTVIDSPDALFIINGVRHAIECRCINETRLMEWSNTKIEKVIGRRYEIRVPWEPDIWVLKSVMEKENKAKIYLENSHADDIWLVLHTSPPPEIPFFDLDEETIKFLKSGCNLKRHSFARIFLCHNESGILEIFNRTDEKREYWKIDPKWEPYYLSLRQAHMRISIGPTNIVNMGERNTIESITLPKLRDKFEKKYGVETRIR
jgi:hypothetical protein